MAEVIYAERVEIVDETLPDIDDDMTHLLALCDVCDPKGISTLTICGLNDLDPDLDPEYCEDDDVDCVVCAAMAPLWRCPLCGELTGGDR